MVKLEQQNEGCNGLGPNKLGFILGDDDDYNIYNFSATTENKHNSNNYQKWFDKILLFIESIIGD